MIQTISPGSGIPFIKRIEGAQGQVLDVQVHEIPRPDRFTGRCRRWMELVHNPHIKGDARRADADWDWPTIAALTFFGGLARRPRMFQLCLSAGDFPIGMLALLENERWVEDHARSAVYVWYVAGAPSAAVSQHGGPKSVTAAVLDIAVTVALNGPPQGRVWLHAAPEGGARLLTWYAQQGLAPVAQHVRLPQPRVGSRPNDGRYFLLAEQAAMSFSRKMEGFRV